MLRTLSARCISCPQWWNWRLSAHLRIASLISAYIVVLLSGFLEQSLLIPLTLVRSSLSAAQSWFNIGLGHRLPVGKPDRLDGLLIVLIIVGAYVGAVILHFNGNVISPIVFLPILLPFSVLQLRMAMRAYTTHAKAQSVIVFEGKASKEEDNNQLRQKMGA